MYQSRRPRIDPWRVPQVKLAQSLYEESIFVLCFRKLYITLTKLRLRLSKLSALRFAIKR